MYADDFQEEDFTTQLFNRELLHQFDVNDILQIGMASLDNISDFQDAGLIDAITSRLGFRAAVLAMFSLQNTGRESEASQYAEVLTTLQRLETTHTIGKPVTNAFSTKIQRRLASTVPPRPMVTVSMSEAWKFWQQFIADCENVFQVFEAQHSHDLLTAYQIFAHSDPQVSVYPRALLQSFLTRSGRVTDRVTAIQLIEEDTTTLTLAASPVRQQFGMNNGNIVRSYATFLDRFEISFINLHRALCLNSCRIRRTFCHALIEWDNLQVEIEEIDTVIHQELAMKPILIDGAEQFPFSLSSWVYHHKLCVLEQTIQMGFQQMIYAPQELAGMYWYLSYICDQHLQHLERITAFTADRRSHVNGPDAESKQRECKTAVERQFRHFAYARATSLLAMAIHGIFIILQRHSIFTTKESVYSNDEWTFEIRMKPFCNLTIPEPLPADIFEEETNMKQSTTPKLLEQAMKSAVGARKAWEEIGKLSWNMFPLANGTTSSVLQEMWSQDVKDCVKAAIAANLCLLTLKKGIADASWIDKARKMAKIPQPGEKGRRHRWWIIPELPPV